MEQNCNYNLRGSNVLNRRKVNSVSYSKESLSCLAPKIWDILPKEIKKSETLNVFKAKIKNWVPQECPLHLPSGMTLQNICTASRIYLRNNTIAIKLHISLNRLRSTSFYFRKCHHYIKLICIYTYYYTQQ